MVLLGDIAQISGAIQDINDTHKFDRNTKQPLLNADKVFIYLQLGHT